MASGFVPAPNMFMAAAKAPSLKQTPVDPNASACPAIDNCVLLHLPICRDSDIHDGQISGYKVFRRVYQPLQNRYALFS